MKKSTLLLTTLLLSSFSAMAATVGIGNSTFEVKRPHALNAVYSAVDDMPGFLKKFKPKGAQISGLSVHGDNLEFTVTKNVLMITRSARVNADLTVDEKNPACPQGSVAGFKVNFDLGKSEQVVVDNVDSIRMDFCVSEKNPDQLTITSKGFLVQGPKYEKLIGGMIVSEITNQVPALVQAFKTHIEKQP